jgi:hypothetical protein
MMNNEGQVFALKLGSEVHVFFRKIKKAKLRNFTYPQYLQSSKMDTPMIKNRLLLSHISTRR